MFRQTLALRSAGALAVLAFSLAALTASAEDLDVSSIAKDDVKNEASSSGSWLPSWGKSSSSSAPAVASSASSVAWYDPLGLFTGGSEPESTEPVRRQGLGVTATYEGSSLDTSARIKTSGGRWWDPLELFYASEQTVVYDDVNGFLAQPRMTD